MTRKRLTPEDIAELQFDECQACTLVLTNACRNCEAGENFEDADEPIDTVDFMRRWA